MDDPVGGNSRPSGRDRQHALCPSRTSRRSSTRSTWRSSTASTRVSRCCLGCGPQPDRRRGPRDACRNGPTRQHIRDGDRDAPLELRGCDAPTVGRLDEFEQRGDDLAARLTVLSLDCPQRAPRPAHRARATNRPKHRSIAAAAGRQTRHSIRRPQLGATRPRQTAADAPIVARARRRGASPSTAPL